MIFDLTSPLFEVSFLLVLLSLSDSSEKKQLYTAIKNGDEGAFKTFYDSQFDKLFIYLKNRGIQPDEAEDIIQKAFIYIWENRKKIKPGLSLKSYLYKIAYTRMINYVEQRKETSEWKDGLHANTNTPLDSIKHSDLNDAVKAAIRVMPERRRAVFEHCFLNELTYKETAEVLSISPKTVENHMALALRDIRKSLKIFKEN